MSSIFESCLDTRVTKNPYRVWIVGYAGVPYHSVVAT
jgi:hypothetical protein